MSKLSIIETVNVVDIGSPMNIPSAYQSGYEKARALNPELAAKYVE